MNVLNNYIEKIILTRESYDELNAMIDSERMHASQLEEDIKKIKKDTDEIADENHALKQLLLKNSMVSDWIFKENSLEKVMDFESCFCGIEHTKLKELRKLISDEEIEIAIEMHWRKLNNKEEEYEDVRF